MNIQLIPFIRITFVILVLIFITEIYNNDFHKHLYLDTCMSTSIKLLNFKSKILDFKWLIKFSIKYFKQNVRIRFVFDALGTNYKF